MLQEVGLSPPLVTGMELRHSCGVCAAVACAETMWFQVTSRPWWPEPWGPLCSAWTGTGVDKGSSGLVLGTASPRGVWDRGWPGQLKSRDRTFGLHEEGTVQLKDAAVGADPKEQLPLAHSFLGAAKGTSIPPEPSLHHRLTPVPCTCAQALLHAQHCPGPRTPALPGTSPPSIRSPSS